MSPCSSPCRVVEVVTHIRALVEHSRLCQQRLNLKLACRPGDWSAEGKQIATAAKQAGVQHFIWSTLANVEKVSEGQWVVPHWTGKAVVCLDLTDL